MNLDDYKLALSLIGCVHNEDLPPQHKQQWQYLSGHFAIPMVLSSHNLQSSLIRLFAAVRPESRWPAGKFWCIDKMLRVVTGPHNRTLVFWTIRVVLFYVPIIPDSCANGGVLMFMSKLCFCLSLPFEQVPEIAKIYKTDKTKYENLAKEWTNKFAMWNGDARFRILSGEYLWEMIISGFCRSVL